MIDSPYLVRPGKKASLSKRQTSETGPFRDKADAHDAIQQNLKKLATLQEVLYAQAKHALLVVFQAMDAGGKDGCIEFIFSGLDPQGCQVMPFKAPTLPELAHDYLWRVHAHVPPRGMIGIFNRSHYEDIVTVRVRKLQPERVWQRRYEHVNAFEKMLTDEDVTILKFFLHISKDEQKKRLQARLDNPKKHWKFNVGDLAERRRWDDYMQAYDDALERCSTEHAPWYIIPSDRKWFRNWAVSEILVQALERLDLRYPPPAPGLDQIVID